MSLIASDTPFSRRLDQDWHIQSSEKIAGDGRIISSPEFDDSHWYPAPVPGTVLNALRNNQVYQDVFIGENLKKIPRAPFEVNWWFRHEFILSAAEAGKTIILDFDGINYKASVWLNGHKIADENTVEGPFRQFRFNITDKIITGANVLAIEVVSP